MQQQEELAEAVQEIQQFRKQLGNTLANSPNFRQRAEFVLERLQNGFAHVVGTGFAIAETHSTEAGPLKTFMGQRLPEVPVPASVQEPTLSELDVVRAEVDKAYTAFPALEAGEIREHYADLVIRAVAKRAGMNVTPTEPAKLTNAYLDSIKEAIAGKAEHDAKVAEAEAVSEDIKAKAKGPAGKK